MSYPSDPQPPRQDPYADSDERLRREDARYQDGYVERRQLENERLFLEEQRIRDSRRGASGLLTGLAFALIVGLGIITWYLLTQRNNRPVQQITVPQSSSPPLQAPASPPDVKLTVPSVEVPQAPQVPSSAPDIDIKVPAVKVPQAPSSTPKVNNNITIPSSQPETTPASPSDSTNSTDNSSSSNNSEQGQ